MADTQDHGRFEGTRDLDRMRDLTLVKVKKVLRSIVPREFAEGASVEILADIMRDRFEVMIETELNAVKLEPVTHTSTHLVGLEVPASPWQHAKVYYRDRWWMRLLLALHVGYRRDGSGQRRREPRMITHQREVTARMVVEPLAILPEMDLLPAQLGRRVLDVSGFRADWTT
jgi:hypothetical protein